jgi:hypothetical protein
MRRDYFTLDVRNLGGDDAEAPVVRIDFDGPAEQLRDRLTGEDEGFLPADRIDIAYRLHGPVEGEGTDGVVAVANRVTGEFVLELNADADDVLRFIDAARDFGKATDEGFRYRAELLIDGEPLTEYAKSTFLVYDVDGELLRGHSLIPSGVEL